MYMHTIAKMILIVKVILVMQWTLQLTFKIVNLITKITWLKS